MSNQEFDQFLSETLADEKFSRKEKDLLKDLLADTQADEGKLALYRSQAFDAARAAMNDPHAEKILKWLEGVVKVLQNRTQSEGSKPVVESYFSPDDDCPEKIAHLISRASRSIDICVFTITDNRLAGAILDAHKKGIALRILTDNDKMDDRGADIYRLAESGISVRTDTSPAHMHHKFAIFDQNLLLTGSYNWTRGAAQDNQENFVVTNDIRLVQQFLKAFEAMWPRMEEVK